MTERQRAKKKAKEILRNVRTQAGASCVYTEQAIINALLEQAKKYRAVVKAAKAVYEHDDTWTEDVTEEQTKKRAERDTALGKALSALEEESHDA